MALEKILFRNLIKYLDPNINCKLIKILAIALLTLSINSCTRQVQFDSQKWKSSGGELILTDNRLSMTDDLIKRKLLINKTKSEIDNLLGMSFPDTHSAIETHLYLVKEEYSMDIDPDKLIYIVVEFDHLGKANKVELFEDK